LNPSRSVSAEHARHSERIAGRSRALPERRSKIPSPQRTPRLDAVSTKPPETPVMAQYAAAKRRFPDALLFFRVGDFFELFHDDAKVASKALGLTLTARDKARK